MTVALRRANVGDSGLIFQWFNLDSLANKLRTQRPIVREEHEQWFAARLADPDTFLWIIEAKSLPVGQLRLMKRGDAYEIDIFVEADARRSGVAHTALRLGMEELRRARASQVTFRALVMRPNVVSQRFFEHAGFGLTAQHANHLVYDLTVP